MEKLKEDNLCSRWRPWKQIAQYIQHVLRKSFQPKRNKPSSCIVIKEQHTYAFLEPHFCFKNNLTQPPTEIQCHFSILSFFPFVLLKHHNEDKLLIEALGTYFTVYQAIIYWRQWNNSIFDVTSHLEPVKEATRTYKIRKKKIREKNNCKEITKTTCSNVF